MNDRVTVLLDRYNFETTRLSHLILTFMPITTKILSKYKLDSSTALTKEDLSNFSTVFLPLSIKFPLTERLVVGLVNENKNIGKIYYIDKHSSDLKTILIHPRNPVYNLPISFNFYFLIINNKEYIVGVNYISDTSLRKIRMTMLGCILEDVIDTVLPNNTVKRVKGKNTLIFKDNKVIE